MCPSNHKHFATWNTQHNPYSADVALIIFTGAHIVNTMTE